MRTFYYSDYLDKYFETEKACLTAEAEAKKKEEEAKKKLANKEARMKEIEDTYIKYMKLLDEYTRDFGFNYKFSAEMDSDKDYFKTSFEDLNNLLDDITKK